MRVLSKLRLGNINKVKLASEASQENFAFFTTKYEKLAKIRTLGLSKSGVRGLKPTCPPTFERGGGAYVPADPFSYVLDWCG